MSDLVTPADLAKFVHRVPVGVVLPAGAEVLLGPTRRRPDHWIGPRRLQSAREVTEGSEFWTREPILVPEPTLAEPVPAPEPTLAERARALKEGFSWKAVDLDKLAAIVAELAEKVEGDHE